MSSTAHIYIFDRFIKRIEDGRKKQTMIFGKKVRTVQPCQEFCLTRFRAGFREVFAQGVCTGSESAHVDIVDEERDRIQFGNAYEINRAKGSEDLDEFAVREGFKAWDGHRGFRKFHVNAGRLKFTCCLVRWSVLKFTNARELA
jgi:hypothetical protein